MDEFPLRLIYLIQNVETTYHIAYGKEAFLFYISASLFAFVDFLLKDGQSDVNQQDKDQQTMLFSSAEYGHWGIMKLILAQERIDVNIKDKNGRSALSWAAEKAPLEAVKILADDTRTDMQSTCRQGRNPFSWSCWSADQRVLEYMIKKDPGNVDTHAVGDETCTPLHYLVAKRNHTAHSIRALLATRKVDINAKDHYGRTTLSHAISTRETDLVKLLVEEGANVKFRHNDGITPMEWAESFDAGGNR